MKTILCIMFLTFAVNLHAQPTAPNYYPLKVGHGWTYKIGGLLAESEQSVKVIGYLDQYGAYVVRTVFKLGANLPITTESLIEPRGNNILVLATRGGLLNSDWIFTSGQIELKMPLTLKSSWKTEKTELGEKQYTEYKVVSLIELTVSAGTFKRVWKIRKTTRYHDRKTGKMEIGQDMFQYYAANVGLLKEEIIGTNESTKMFRELVNYETN